MKPRPISGERAQWGGKGAGILLLRELELRTPFTFGLQQPLVGEWLRSLPGHSEGIAAWTRWPGPEAELPAALDDYRKTLLHEPMPDEWFTGSSWLRTALSGCPAIVRSSMSGEDSGCGSFAGAFASVRVEKPSPEILWRALTAVLASGYTRQAALRWLGSGLEPTDFAPSAIFQPWVGPQASGVCFSRDPLAPWAAGGIIEWTDQPGASVVQGEGASFTHRQGAGEADPVLAPFVGELWAACARAEERLGAPADIEWAWDGSRLWFLQLRPVATEEARALARCRSSGTRLDRELAEERFPEPMTALGWTAIEDTLAPNLTALEEHFGIVPKAKAYHSMAASVRGWIYSDPDFFEFPKRVSIRWKKFLISNEGHLGSVCLALVRQALRPSKPLLKLDLALALLEPQGELIGDAWEDHVERHLAVLRAFRLPLSSAGLLGAMEDLRRISLSFLEPDLAVFLVKDSLRKALLGVWCSAGLREEEFPRLVSAFAGNRTIAMGEDWDCLVAALSADPGAASFLDTHDPATLQTARGAWENFIARNGHCRTSWDIAVPGWAEEPARMAEALRASLASGAKSRRRSDRRQEARDELYARLEVRGLGSAIPRVGRAILLLEDFMRMDEELHFLSGLLLDPSRKLVLEAGRLLCRQGDLEEPADVFHLKLGELKSHLRDRGPTLRFLARRRRAEWEHSRSILPPSEIPATKAPPSLPAAAESASSRQGFPVSPGVVIGPLHVLDHLEDARDLPVGAVLLTRSPNPALVPLYPVLGGMICSTGGMLSHGFVAARELGLPAVSGIRSFGEDQLSPGQWVRLDGATGRIDLLDGPPA